MAAALEHVQKTREHLLLLSLQSTHTNWCLTHHLPATHFLPTYSYFLLLHTLWIWQDILYLFKLSYSSLRLWDYPPELHIRVNNTHRSVESVFRCVCCGPVMVLPFPDYPFSCQSVKAAPIHSPHVRDNISTHTHSVTMATSGTHCRQICAYTVWQRDSHMKVSRCTAKPCLRLSMSFHPP